jgi:hypothetical protein
LVVPKSIPIVFAIFLFSFVRVYTNFYFLSFSYSSDGSKYPGPKGPGFGYPRRGFALLEFY